MISNTREIATSRHRSLIRKGGRKKHLEERA